MVVATSAARTGKLMEIDILGLAGLAGTSVTLCSLKVGSVGFHVDDAATLVTAAFRCRR